MGGEGECDIDNHDTWYGCPICEKAELKGGEVKKPTNYDRIRNMSIEKMAEFLENTNSNCAIKLGDGYIVRDKLYIRIWLESEVTE
jgi:hypothetical protein